MIKTLSAILVEPKRPLEIEELILPDPTPKQVVVEQTASGLCLSQVHEIDKTPLDQCPKIIGHEGVGIATHIGSAVTSIKEGDHVITTWVPRSNFTEEPSLHSHVPKLLKNAGFKILNSQHDYAWSKNKLVQAVLFNEFNIPSQGQPR